MQWALLKLSKRRNFLQEVGRDSKFVYDLDKCLGSLQKNSAFYHIHKPYYSNVSGTI